jgi:hypothetical protein
METAVTLSHEHVARTRKRRGRWLRITLAIIGALVVLAAIAVGVATVAFTRAVVDIPKTETGSSPAPTFPARPARQMASLATIAQLPAGSFIENLAVRRDGSILFTEETKHQLWYLAAATADTHGLLIPLHTFGQRPMGIVETQPNVFYVTTSDLRRLHSAYLYRVDLRHWQPGLPVPVQTVLHFPIGAIFLDGSTALAPNVILAADAIGGAIWRVDLSADGLSAKARRWLKDPSMAVERNSHVKGVPGVNGVRYDAKTHFLYYTSTGQKLFMQERVDPVTLNPVGAPQVVASGSMWDDFAIDDQANVAYLTTHRQNSIERVPLDPRTGQALKTTVAGMPLDARLVGPASFAWGRAPGDYGEIGYVSTDGGTTAPPAALGKTPAKVLRVVLPAGRA